MSDQKEEEGKTLSQEQLLSALDAEIETLATEQSSAGWSRWAILLGLGGLIWLGVDTWEKGTFDLRAVIILTLVMSSLWDLLRTSTTSLNSWNFFRSAGPPRFIMLSHFLGAFRPTLALGIIKDTIFLTAIIWLSSLLLLPLGICIGFSLIANVISFVLSYVVKSFSFLFPQSETPKLGRFPRFSSVFPIISYSFNLIAVILSLAFVWYSQTNIVPPTVRLALISVGLMYLLSLLADERIPTTRLQAMRTIRRNLAFRWISAQEACIQSDLILVGGRLTQLLQRPFEELLFAINRTQSTFGETESIRLRYAEVSKRIPAVQITFEDAESKPLSKSLQIGALRAVAEFKDIDKRLRNFEINIQVVLLFSPASASEVEPLMQKINAAMKPLREHLKVFTQIAKEQQ